MTQSKSFKRKENDEECHHIFANGMQYNDSNQEDKQRSEAQISSSMSAL